MSFQKKLQDIIVEDRRVVEPVGFHGHNNYNLHNSDIHIKVGDQLYGFSSILKIWVWGEVRKINEYFTITMFSKALLEPSINKHYTSLYLDGIFCPKRVTRNMPPGASYKIT